MGTQRQDERHLAGRGGWLRAAVLGADDGIVSTASIMLGVTAAHAARGAVITAGVAGLVAGAMSMAAGEFVSVASQSDVEEADIEREIREQAANPEAEFQELVAIYRARGLSEATARTAVAEMTRVDPLGSHVRDELGLVAHLRARPAQAAVASAVAFAIGGLIPLIVLLLAPSEVRATAVVAAALMGLAALGVLGAVAGGAPRRRAAWRVLIGGAAAMAATALIGSLLGTAL